jgi:hypothetical protein
MKTFTPPSKSPTEKWLFSGGKKSNYTAPPTKWVKRVTSTNARKETSNSKNSPTTIITKRKIPRLKLNGIDSNTRRRLML